MVLVEKTDDARDAVRLEVAVRGAVREEPLTALPLFMSFRQITEGGGERG
jgi:uncharacterized protein with GYD domain